MGIETPNTAFRLPDDKNEYKQNEKNKGGYTLPRVDYFEGKVYEIEQFSISILNTDNSNVRGDKQIPNGYSYTRAARNDWTVSEWIANRFNPILAGYNVAVFDGSGNPVQGNTKLSSVRATY